MRGFDWSEDENRVLRTYYKCKGPRYCKALLKDRSHTAVKAQAAKLGLRMEINKKHELYGNKPPLPTIEEINEMCKKLIEERMAEFDRKNVGDMYRQSGKIAEVGAARGHMHGRTRGALC